MANVVLPLCSWKGVLDFGFGSVSIATVASSRIRMSGSCRMVRAMERRCFSPPKILPACANPGFVGVGQLHNELVAAAALP